ncbi:MAG TPA: hypothetical protein VH590_19580 [Ktedonobacterales bacterium]
MNAAPLPAARGGWRAAFAPALAAQVAVAPEAAVRAVGAAAQAVAAVRVQVAAGPARGASVLAAAAVPSKHPSW